MKNVLNGRFIRSGYTCCPVKYICKYEDQDIYGEIHIWRWGQWLTVTLLIHQHIELRIYTNKILPLQDIVFFNNVEILVNLSSKKMTISAPGPYNTNCSAKRNIVDKYWSPCCFITICLNLKLHPWRTNCWLTGDNNSGRRSLRTLKYD